MISSDAELPTERGAEHEALSVFLGEWKAERKSFNAPVPQQPISIQGAPHSQSLSR
jgi:hypothetical protein